jgi:hypothetical protein
MVSSFLLSAGFVLAWTLSPEALTLFGNSTGATGPLFLLGLAGGLIFTALAVRVLQPKNPAGDGGPSQLKDSSAAVGAISAMTVLLASRLGLVLLLPTGVLVTAGFAFNETFYHRFPNFAFSALLLGLIAVIHLGGKKLVNASQMLFVTATAMCLLFIIGAGLVQGLDRLPEASPESGEITGIPGAFFTTLVLFLGYDQGRPGTARDVILTLACGGAIYALWSLVSLGHVPRDALANSTLPYLLTAREVLGQPGRLIIAAAVIAGSCGVVNGLFSMANGTLQHIANTYPLTRRSIPGGQERIYPMIFALFIAVALTGGLAGSDNLTTYIHACLLLWLLATAMLNYGAAKRLLLRDRQISYLGYAITALYLLAIIWLAAKAPQSGELLVFSFLLLTAAALLAVTWRFASRKRFGAINSHNQGETL